MNSLSYKTFVWPHNPHTYREEYRREPHYVTQSGVTIFDGMGGMQRVITGSGAFFGEDAFQQFEALADLLRREKREICCILSGEVGIAILPDCS